MEAKIKDAINVFSEKTAKIYSERLLKLGAESITFKVTIGKKYAKLCRDNSVHAFIDKNTGDIFKPASWNAPAKHARGNVLSETGGLEALDGLGFIRYLR